MENTNSQAPQGQNSGENRQTIIIQNQPSKSNGIGTAGFVLALIALVFCLVPILNGIVWFLGLVLSAIGVFRQPSISLIGLIILFAFVGLFAAGAAGAAAAGH